MLKKKKYLILFLIIIILLIFALFMTKNQTKDTVKNTQERVSNDYKITEDVVILNIPKENNLTLKSLDFLNLGIIPSQFTCDGDDINPNLEISGVDKNANSLVLIMDDPDAPDGVWDHWVKFNLPAETTIITAGEPLEGISGKGTGGSLDYSGPCPPGGEHHYVFKLYSLDTELILAEGSSKTEVEKAMEGHILQKAELIGVYERAENIKTQEH